MLYVVASSYVLCERIISRTRTLVRCHRNGCMRESLVENIDKIEDIDPLKKKMCLHAQVWTCLNLRVPTEQMKKNILLRFLMWKGKKIMLSCQWFIHPLIKINKFVKLNGLAEREHFRKSTSSNQTELNQTKPNSFTPNQTHSPQTKLIHSKPNSSTPNQTHPYQTEVNHI